MKTIEMDYWIYIGVFAAAIAVYAMINVLMGKFSARRRMIWFAIVVLMPVVGPLVYLLNGKAIQASLRK